MPCGALSIVTSGLDPRVSWSLHLCQIPGSSPGMTGMWMIEVQGLVKHYQVTKREGGFAKSLRAFFKRQYETVRAVDGINFAIGKGEIVGFLGPNGAGKTTTLKMLAGLLYPTAGTLSVAGFQPQERRRAFLTTIAMVLGQKQQLIWDLPPTDTFLLNKEILAEPGIVRPQQLDRVGAGGAASSRSRSGISAVSACRPICWRSASLATR
jgi:hypothetical protein